MKEVTTGEAARELDVSVQRVHALVDRGKLRCRRVGRRGWRLINAEDVLRLKRDRERAAVKV